MRHLLLLPVLVACTAEPVDTDGDDTARTFPRRHLGGDWLVVADALLPNQSEGWCERLAPDRFREVSNCFAEPTECAQGVAFEQPGGFADATWRVEVRGQDCDGGGPITVMAEADYGSFEWLGPTEDDTGDEWRVNARLWTVTPVGVGGEELRVQSGSSTFNLLLGWPG